MSKIGHVYVDQIASSFSRGSCHWAPATPDSRQAAEATFLIEVDILSNVVLEHTAHIALRSSARFDDFFFPWRPPWRGRWDPVESPTRPISSQKMSPSMRHILPLDRRLDSMIFFSHGDSRGEVAGDRSNHR